MTYLENPQTKNKVIVEKIDSNGNKEFIGYYDPEKIIHITSKKEIAEFLIVEKGLKLFQIVVGQDGKFYFVLLKEK